MLEFSAGINIINLTQIICTIIMIGLFNKRDDHFSHHIAPQNNYLSLIEFCRINEFLEDHRGAMYIRGKENTSFFIIAEQAHFELL